MTEFTQRLTVQKLNKRRRSGITHRAIKRGPNRHIIWSLAYGYERTLSGFQHDTSGKVDDLTYDNGSGGKVILDGGESTIYTGPGAKKSDLVAGAKLKTI